MAINGSITPNLQNLANAYSSSSKKQNPIIKITQAPIFAIQVLAADSKPRSFWGQEKLEQMVQAVKRAAANSDQYPQIHSPQNMEAVYPSDPSLYEE